MCIYGADSKRLPGRDGGLMSVLSLCACTIVKSGRPTTVAQHHCDRHCHAAVYDD